MRRPMDRRALAALLLAAAAYAAIGVVFAAVANAHGPGPAQRAWRLAAWALSAGVFAVHTWHEHAAGRSAARTVALPVALAVALAGFALAAPVALRAHAAAGHGALRALALVLWPLLVGVPAYVVALISAALLARGRR